ncbi:MAG: hypothetical protein JW761_04685 [Prolixibacteraceae bacterium]|nr:hypothetical protein [Prolixibacteraceae bacterium]
MKKFTLFTVFFLMSLFIFGQQANFNWVEENISEGTNLREMTLSGDTSAVIIGFGNTLKKKTVGTQNWTDIGTFNAMYDFVGLGAGNGTTILSSRKTKIVDHPAGGKTDVYVSGVLLKSDNMGETWSLLDAGKIGTGDNPATNPNAVGSYTKDIYSVGVFNSDTFLVYTGWYDISTGSKETQGGIFLTRDGGEEWQPVATELGSNVINSIEVYDSIAISGGNQSLFKTNINADTTIDIYPNLAAGTDSNLYVFAVKMTGPDTFYLTTIADGVFKTTDGGATFTKFEGIDGGNDVLPLNDSSLIVLGSSSKSKISTDYGETWTNCYPGKTCYKIGGILGDTLYGMGNTYAYKIAVSDLIEKNVQWVSTELNPGENLQKMWIYDQNHALIIGFGKMSKTTSDGGLTWKQSTLPDDFNEDIEFDFTSISNNGENAFTTVRRFKMIDFPSATPVNDFFIDGLVLQTTDNWNSYTLLDISKIGANEATDATLNPQLEGCYGLNPYSVECVDANTAYLYAGWFETVTTGESESRGRIFKTTDGGETWSGITPDFGNAYINAIEFTGDTGFFAGNNIFLKTVNGGENLSDLFPALVAANEDDNTIFVNSITMAGSNKFYLSTTSDGVFMTDDGGETFSKFDGVNGTNDMYLLDGNSFMLLGTASKSYFTNDGGTTWQNPLVGKTVFRIGEVFNDSLYAMGSGVVYKIAVNDLDITTSVNKLALNNELQIQYEADHINIVSKQNPIDQCLVYSVTGRLLTIKQPKSTICRLNNYNFKPGIYVVAISVKGEKFTDKIIFK